MSAIRLLLLIVLLMIVLGALPVWPYAATWGYGPSGFGLIVLILVIVALVYAGKGDRL